MGRVTGSFSRPIQGVSQQPAKIRLDGQCELSDNFRPDVVQGLISRPGTRLTAFLSGLNIPSTSKVYYYARGNSEEYFVILDTSGGVEVYSPDGTKHIVSAIGSPKTYTSCNDANADIDMVTVGDFTFISHNKKTVRESSSVTPALSHRAVIYVQFMDYSQTQRVFINGSSRASYTSPDGTSASHKASVGTEYVAEQLRAGLASSLGSYWHVERQASCVYIWRTDFGSFTMTTEDDAGGDNLKGVKSFAKNISDLPPRAPEGMQVEMRPPGSTAESNNRYWLTASRSDNSDNVIWNESIEPSITVGMDLTTMPHVLVRESISNGTATFTYRAGEWQDRDVGNEDNNPLPSFVGGTIQNIGIFQNRLYFTSDESVTMSRTSNFFNFFRTTSQSVLDTDPIDVYADAQKVNVLKASSALDGDLIFFSDNGQFRLPGSVPISPGSAALTQETQFQSNTNAAPVASGENLFFAFDYGDFVGIREFYTDNTTDTKRARPITEHVSRYIQGTVRKMASSTTINTLVVQSDVSDRHLYIYDWLWQGTDKVQSAWGRWVLPEGDAVKHFVFNKQYLYLMIQRASGVTVERIDMGDPDEAGIAFPVRLDMLYSSKATYSAAEACWVMDDRLPFIAEEELVGVRSTGCYDADIGLDITLERRSGNLSSLDDLSDPIDGAQVDVYIGRTYECEYIPNQPVIKDQYDKPIGIDKLMLGVIWVNYERTGDVIITVEDRYGRMTDYEFNGRLVGGLGNLIGFSPEQDGSFRVPIRQKSDEVKMRVKTNSHRPLQVRDFEYEGYWRPRGQRR